jgi:hypothetical protein
MSQDFIISDRSQPSGIVFVSGKGFTEAGDVSTQTGFFAPGRRAWIFTWPGLEVDGDVPPGSLQRFKMALNVPNAEVGRSSGRLLGFGSNMADSFS